MTRPEVGGFVRAWATSLHATRFVPMTRDERRTLLYGLADRLAGALVAAEFDPTVGYRVGVELVRAEYAVPECLGRTVALLTTRLLDDLDLAGDGTARDRLGALVDALATGFARAAHDATLDAQEATRLAAWAARDRAMRTLRAHEVEFRRAALQDPLTGLANRLRFMDWLADAAARDGTRLGLCRIDLDGFQAINDALGYGVGDRVLCAVADRLGVLADEGGYLVARLDGDRFALLVLDTGAAEDVTKVADRALATIVEPVRVDGNVLPVTGVAGVVELAAGEADAEETLRAAEIALRWSRADGRGWSLFEQERSARDVARYRLSAALPGALGRGEFRLAYQPLVSLDAGRLAGVEALARWHHPELGVLGPDRFIGLAEDTGAIVPLGITLLEQACRQAVAWLRYARGPFYVSVNLAVRQIRQPGLVANVAEILDRTGLPPAALQLEITESAALGADTETFQVLRGLTDLGVRIVVDDFGTGYSNLASLHIWPLHGIKLAGTFVEHLGTQAGHDAFLGAVVSFAQRLGLAVTAEGVETAEQARRLRGIGCETAQGWYFGYPVGPDQITRQLRT
ncbi:MAG TPA: bifunctional diguanylate cyclase/phosphodiesterase [Rugosimonospora sp.]|nr:bifunctional diguanylate cyclase/phosphodiesterase [Rugosimonospora sp.]